MAAASPSVASYERAFFASMAFLILASVLLGFARTFYLKAWFPEVQHLAAPEPIFALHGALFTLWFLLLAVQPVLISRGARAWHARLGRLGGGLALLMVLIGYASGLTAAARPGGFIGVPVPPLQFLVVIFSSLSLFGLFVLLALAKRRDAQSHKRYMLLASISLIEAAVARWPFAFAGGASPVPLLGMTELISCAFVLPMVVWDIYSTRRVHPVTLGGGLALAASFALRMPLAETNTWHQFASWAIGLLSALEGK